MKMESLTYRVDASAGSARTTPVLAPNNPFLRAVQVSPPSVDFRTVAPESRHIPGGVNRVRNSSHAHRTHFIARNVELGEGGCAVRTFEQSAGHRTAGDGVPNQVVVRIDVGRILLQVLSDIRPDIRPSAPEIRTLKEVVPASRTYTVPETLGSTKSGPPVRRILSQQGSAGCWVR